MGIRSQKRRCVFSCGAVIEVNGVCDLRNLTCDDRIVATQVLSDFTTTATVVAYSANGQYLAAAEAGGRSIYVYDHSSWTIKNPLGWQYHNAAVGVTRCSLLHVTC